MEFAPPRILVASMKLYYAPGTSAVGIRILLEEIGRPYEVVPVDLRAGEQYQPAFIAVNPKSKVPTLVRDDNSVLTEFGAIARWLARTNPEAALLPAEPEAEARATELLDYVVGTVHMRGFSRMIVPAAFGPAEQREDIVAAEGALRRRGSRSLMSVFPARLMRWVGTATRMRPCSTSSDGQSSSRCHCQRTSSDITKR
jgi:glutathione S-transferase